MRLERNQALIDERVRELVHAVTLERLDGEPIEASVGNSLRRASVRGLPLFSSSNLTARMPISPAVLSYFPYRFQAVLRHFLKSPSVRVGPRWFSLTPMSIIVTCYVVDVTVLGLVGGAPGGETPRVADSS